MSGLIDALAPYLTSEIAAPAGATLFRQDDEVRHFHVVRSGCVHLVRYTEGGSAAVMQRAEGGSVLAESSIFATNYHCDGLVVADASIARADMKGLRQTLRSERHLLEAVTRHLAKEVQRTRSRLELLARKTVADRLDGWLALNGGMLPERGAWRLVAEDLGVSPEAFYRELKRRRDQSSLSRSLR